MLKALSNFDQTKKTSPLGFASSHQQNRVTSASNSFNTRSTLSSLVLKKPVLQNNESLNENESKKVPYNPEPDQALLQITNKMNSMIPNKVNKNYLSKMKKKHRYKVSANISGTKFEIIKNVLESIGCKIASDDNFDVNLIWDDTKVSIEGISELKSFQRYNHFPAMSEISKKDALAKNIMKIWKILPQDFDFVPKTWIMPCDYSSLVSYSIDMKKYQQKKTFIMKPSNGAMGHGIKLYKNVEKIQPTENYIIQEYISNPYLLDGFKFDLRIYALVTSCDPLRAFIFNNGLVRLGTEEYQEPNESNIDHLYMHLTNYSVNKRNKNHYDEGDPSGETGTKRSLKYLFEHLRKNSIDTSKVWKNIQDIILKTLLVAEPYLFHTYKMCRPGQLPGTESVCYEILGFDILLDDRMKPWVLEVNRSPSFGANQQIDFDIKSKLLIDTFELLHLRASDRQRSQTMEKAEAKRRLYASNNYSSKNDQISEPKVLVPSHSNSSLLTNLNNSSNINKKIKSKEKRKLELIDQIKLLRREQKRQEYENRNLGNFSRLFPIDDKYDMDYYLNILNTAFNLFYPIGKHVQWKKTYERIKEDELLTELVECDDDFYDESNYEQYKKINEYLKDDYMTSDTEEESSNSSEEENDHHHHHHRHHQHNHNDQDYRERSKSNFEADLNSDSKRVPTKAIIDLENIKSNRVNTLLNSVSTSSINKTLSNSQNSLNKLTNQKKSDHDLKANEIIHANNSQQLNLLKQLKQHQNKLINGSSSLNVNGNNTSNNMEQDDISNNNLATLTVAVLKLLNQLDIKYPGKTTEQSKTVVQKIYSKLDFYKPKLADYWMVKLDDSKRLKILNIVKSNIIVVLQKVFMCNQVDNLRLYKIFVKLLNRLLWMHGQGLWNCFTTTNNSSWESIFNKSSFQISENELKCCYRIVELCKDCVIIVYQYAFENKPTNMEQSSSLRSTPSSLSNKYKSISISNNSLNLIKSKNVKI